MFFGGFIFRFEKVIFGGGEVVGEGGLFVVILEVFEVEGLEGGVFVPRTNIVLQCLRI